LSITTILDMEDAVSIGTQNLRRDTEGLV